MSYDIVSHENELRAIDDRNLLHMSAALVEGFSWFLLDRNCTEIDDGKACFQSWSGEGRWVIMTPHTASIVCLAKTEEARSTELLPPRIKESLSLLEGNIELAVLVDPEENDSLVTANNPQMEDKEENFKLDDFSETEEYEPSPESDPEGGESSETA